jgi:hypothetical protein
MLPAQRLKCFSLTLVGAWGDHGLPFPGPTLETLPLGREITYAAALFNDQYAWPR